MVPFRSFPVILAFIIFCADVSAQVVSDFATNADGWTAPGSFGPAFLTYTATGGNPNGFVSARTPGSINLGATTVWLPYFFEAPAKFEGNKSAYYGGNLRYDASQSSVVAPVFLFAQVVITDNTGVAIYYHPTTRPQPPVFGTWLNIDVQLTAATGYWKTVDDPAGTVATQAQIQSVLSNINNLQIQGLYSNANATTRLDNITMYPPITVNTQPVNRVVCDGVTTTFATTASNNPNLTYHWQKFTVGVGFLDIANTGGYSGATTATLSVNTTGNFGAGSYRCRISGTAVDDAFTNTVSLTINPLPTAPSTGGASSCGPGTLALTASGAAAGQYRWYTLASGGGLIAGQTNPTFTTPLISTTTIYYAAIDNGTCVSTRTAATATINTPPVAPTVTNGSGCIPSTVTLTASGAAAGQYRWYTVPTFGTPIPGQNNATYTTPSISATTNYYVSIYNGTCESPRTTVVATMSAPPGAPSSNGNSGCSPSAVTLLASGGSPGQFRWYTVATLGTPIPGQSNGSYTTPVLSTTTNYYVSVYNGTCESPRTISIAKLNTPPAAPSVTGAAACSPDSVTLLASGGATGQYRWYTAPTGGPAIAGETGSSYTTPILSTTTNYYVSVDNGTCESTRTLVAATLNALPANPGVVPAASCNAASVTLNATGGSAGQYRWYTAATGQPIPGQTNSSYVTPVLSQNTTFYVSIHNGNCESARVPATVSIGGAVCTNNPPVIQTTEGSTNVGGKVVIDLQDLITDSDNNLALSTLSIVSQPASGAVATIDNDLKLTVDYTGIPFTGTENITIRICDTFSACTQQSIEIEVDGSIEIFNAVSPNKDGKNDVFFIDNIDKLTDTKKNHVAIFNRWGDLVWEGNDYNNTTVVFNGLSKNNSELPSGTYYYKIEFTGGKAVETGYLELKR